MTVIKASLKTRNVVDISMFLSRVTPTNIFQFTRSQNGFTESDLALKTHQTIWSEMTVKAHFIDSGFVDFSMFISRVTLTI